LSEDDGDIKESVPSLLRGGALSLRASIPRKGHSSLSPSKRGGPLSLMFVGVVAYLPPVYLERWHTSLLTLAPTLGNAPLTLENVPPLCI
jgi:hypothetical protein